MERGSVLQLSTYLTLTLAAVCLGFADMFFLRWMPWFLASIGLVFFLAWRNEGRWQLSESAANSLGLVIAFAALGWIVFQLPRTDEDLVAAGVPWPAGLLPHVGPLLMILTAVKLFRPKHIPDFWSLQILAIMMVTLASVLAGEFDHGIWIVLYLVCQVWSLASYYKSWPRWIHLSAEERQRTPLFEPPAAREASVGRWRELGGAAAWSIAIAVLGTGLFIGIPRQGSSQWIPHKLAALSAARLGGGLDSGLDLNRTDKVELSNEVAFEFDAIDARGEAGNVSPSIYWRSDTYDVYMNGRWYCANHVAEQTTDANPRHQSPADAIVLYIIPTGEFDQSRNPRVRPSDLPADSLYVSIHVLPALAGNLVCAEPVDVERGIGIAPLNGERPSRSAIFAFLDGADLVVSQGRRMTYRYGQAIDPDQDPLRVKANRIATDYRTSILTQGPPDGLFDWSRELLQRVGGLSGAERLLDDVDRVPPAHHGRVALAICQHFASSGEYLYSLNRRRVDLHADPNIDFLANVKEGHCERYASGLALTLRSLGIPARVVHGFNGYERGDDGVLRVRFTRAHSWVQALVPRSQGVDYDWLLLDPTPSEEAPLDRWQRLTEWISDTIRAMRSGFHNNVLEYGANTPFTELRNWWANVTTGQVALSLAALTALAALAAACHWGRTPLTEWLTAQKTARLQKLRAPWLTQALALIQSAAGISPAQSDTLLEFTARLRASNFAAFAAPFATIAEYANRVRFGQVILSAADECTLAGALDELRLSALATNH